MKITKIEVQKNNKDKVNLFIEDDYYCSLFLDTAIKNSLRAGIDIDKEELDKIIFDSEKNLAYNKSLKYLQTAIKTKKQIFDYLTKKGFSETICNYVIEKLVEYNFLNDSQYALSYYQSYKNKYGLQKIKYSLISKGINKFDLNVLDNIENDEEIVYNIANKYMKNKDINLKNFDKLFRFLASRGFDFEIINNVISRIKRSEKC